MRSTREGGENAVLQPVERGAHRLGGLAVCADDDVEHGVQHRQRATEQHGRVGFQSAGCFGCRVHRTWRTVSA
ncbi:hypothetical protein [Streptomyces sp. NBC_00273]|uniref:hypothetical protein n=1 Tax=Streptomyces sp. NBC_00273 TaxID=2903644 RepID=UPI002E2C7363|nr:hypothetical protein [Streptomyces sp. NBC_00273]